MIKKLLLLITLLGSFAPSFAMEYNTQDLEPEVTLEYTVDSPEDYPFERDETTSVVSDMEYQLAQIKLPHAFNGLVIPFEYVQCIYKMQNK